MKKMYMVAILLIGMQLRGEALLRRCLPKGQRSPHSAIAQWNMNGQTCFAFDAQEVDSLRKQEQHLGAQINMTKGQIAKLRNEIAQKKNELKSLPWFNRAAKETKIASEIAVLVAQLTGLSMKLGALRAAFAAMQGTLAAMLRGAELGQQLEKVARGRGECSFFPDKGNQGLGHSVCISRGKAATQRAVSHCVVAPSTGNKIGRYANPGWKQGLKGVSRYCTVTGLMTK